uniref:B30.2/SPRY domain-containing protein n=1 Tax=Myripristis murdjan TaxID=586833 RepID=A0A667ZML9_9TELE
MMVVHRNHFSLSVSLYLSAGLLQVNVSQAVYQAEENSNITMEWTFTPIRPLTDLRIYFSFWVSEYGPFKWVYYLLSGVDYSEGQDEQFTGRVQLDKDEMRKGSIRLHLSSLRTNDSGIYECQVSTSDGVSIGLFKVWVGVRLLLIHGGVGLQCLPRQQRNKPVGPLSLWPRPSFGNPLKAEEVILNVLTRLEWKQFGVLPWGWYWWLLLYYWYVCPLSLDTDTASRDIYLFGGTRVMGRRMQLLNPDHPQGFQYPHVLCRERLAKRCYWEVEWSGKVHISVTYRGIITGRSEIGYNNQTWTLECSDFSYNIRHGWTFTTLSVHPLESRRVGVYLDWSAGTLSFYRITSDSLRLLHTFKNKFFQPLSPAFSLWSPSASLTLLPVGGWLAPYTVHEVGRFVSDSWAFSWALSPQSAPRAQSVI